MGTVELQQFFADLRKDPSMKNWQVAQAENALVLYYEQFRGIALGDLPEQKNWTQPIVNNVVAASEPPCLQSSERRVNMTALHAKAYGGLRLTFSLKQ